MEKLEQAIEIWQKVCDKWDLAESRQLALGSEFWYPAGPEIAIAGECAANIMVTLKDALADEDFEAVEGLVEKIIAGTHRLQQ